MAVERGGINLKEKTHNPIREGETAGQAYARMVREAVESLRVMRRVNVNDEAFIRADVSLAAIRLDIVEFYSGNSRLHDPLVTFDRLVDVRLRQERGKRPDWTIPLR